MRQGVWVEIILAGLALCRQPLEHAVAQVVQEDTGRDVVQMRQRRHDFAVGLGRKPRGRTGLHVEMLQELQEAWVVVDPSFVWVLLQQGPQSEWIYAL